VIFSFCSRYCERIRMTRFSLSTRRRLALLALAVQFNLLPLSHFEEAAAQSQTAASFGVVPAEFVDAGSLAVASLAASSETSQPVCAICAVATMANAAMLTIPPVFLLPQAVELLHLTVGAEFVHLRPPGIVHRPRANRS
jgi:hypothetical protein